MLVFRTSLTITMFTSYQSLLSCQSVSVPVQYQYQYQYQSVPVPVQYQYQSVPVPVSTSTSPVPVPVSTSTSAIDCLERLVSEMTCYVSSGTLNSAHSLCTQMLTTITTLTMHWSGITQYRLQGQTLHTVQLPVYWATEEDENGLQRITSTDTSPTMWSTDYMYIHTQTSMPALGYH